MSDSVSATDPLHPTQASLPVLARLPRIGAAAIPEPGVAAEHASETELPILVLLDDDPPADATSSDAQQAAIDALADAAAPAWEEDPPWSGVDRGEAPEPVAEESEQDAAGAAPIFRIHGRLAPYSSVIVTVAVIASAGLLFMVASRPAADRLDDNSVWAETTPAVPAAETAAATMASAVGNPTASSSGPPAAQRSTIVVAQRTTSGRGDEPSPRELPTATLGPPQSYPSTGSQSFEEAFFDDGPIASEDDETRTGRYERY